MILKLESIEELIADADIRCDAREIIYDSAKVVDKTDRLLFQRLVLNVVYSKKRIITKGVSYLKFTFLDKTTGELLELNCNKDNHQSCINLKLYPEALLTLLTL